MKEIEFSRTGKKIDLKTLIILGSSNIEHFYSTCYKLIVLIKPPDFMRYFTRDILPI